MQTDHADALAFYLRAEAPDLLDGMVREHPFKPEGKKGPPWRFDVAWPRLMVAVEVDGGRWKPGGGRHGSDGDYRKRNAATVAGWRMLAFTPTLLNNDPVACIAQIRAVLEWQEEDWRLDLIGE